MDLVINNKSYFIPNKWGQVSLGTYMNFMQQIDGIDDEHEKTLITISSFTKAPIKLLEGCKKTDIDNVMAQLTKLLENKANEQLNIIITIDNIDYGFHPNLHELKLKEFVDLDNKLANGWQSMASVMSILYRPIIEQKGEKYKIEDYNYKTDWVLVSVIEGEKSQVKYYTDLLQGKKYRCTRHSSGELYKKLNGEIAYLNGEIMIDLQKESCKFERQDAFTIHSFQGITIKKGQKVFIDLDRLFCPRQLYTALSRVEYLDQIYIMN